MGRRKKLPVIDLHQAWVWDCNGCGTENFARSVVMGMTDEERDRMYSEHGVSKDEIGFWYTSPERVECFECGAQYDTRLDLPGAP
jgi:hypothetical protein